MSKFEIHELALGIHLGPTDRATTQGALGVFLFGGLLSSAFFAMNTRSVLNVLRYNSYPIDGPGEFDAIKKRRRRFVSICTVVTWMIDAGAMALFATSLYLLFVADLDVLDLAIGDNKRLDRCLNSLLLTILVRNVFSQCLVALTPFLRTACKRPESVYNRHVIAPFVEERLADRKGVRIFVAGIVVALALLTLGLGLVIIAKSLLGSDFSSLLTIAYAFIAASLATNTIIVVAYFAQRIASESHLVECFWRAVFSSNILAALVGWAPLVIVLGIPHALAFLGSYCTLSSVVFMTLLSRFTSDLEHQLASSIQVSPLDSSYVLNIAPKLPPFPFNIPSRSPMISFSKLQEHSREDSKATSRAKTSIRTPSPLIFPSPPQRHVPSAIMKHAAKASLDTDETKCTSTESRYSTVVTPSQQQTFSLSYRCGYNSEFISPLPSPLPPVQALSPAPRPNVRSANRSPNGTRENSRISAAIAENMPFYTTVSSSFITAARAVPNTPMPAPSPPLATVQLRPRPRSRGNHQRRPSLPASLRGSLSEMYTRVRSVTSGIMHRPSSSGTNTTTAGPSSWMVQGTIGTPIVSVAALSQVNESSEAVRATPTPAASNAASASQFSWPWSWRSVMDVNDGSQESRVAVAHGGASTITQGSIGWSWRRRSGSSVAAGSAVGGRSIARSGSRSVITNLEAGSGFGPPSEPGVSLGM